MRVTTSLLFSLCFIASVLILGCHYIPPVDPCEGVTCSGHGLCVSGAENAVCECAAGYRAVDRECVAVTSDGDGDGDADGGADGDGDVDGDSDADPDDELDGSGDADADREGDGDGDAGPRCGDGERQDGEACDDGDANSDVVADACRTDCRLPWCGDGVQDSTEACDRGDENSDVVADACRTDCTLARCGDGVQDSTEGCDQGAANSDVVADACRTDCRLPWCGDGVLDSTEECDDENAVDVDGCRTDCSTCELTLEARRGCSIFGGNAMGLVVVDLDGDGFSDAVAVRGTASESSIEVVHHDGVWWPPSTISYPLPECLFSNAIGQGDVDEDGDPDVVVACRAVPSPPVTSLVAVVARGDGTFEPSRGLAEAFGGPIILDIAFGHVDSDANLDLLAGSSPGVLVYRGRAGGYPSVADEVLAPEAYSVLTADMDLDGAVDVVSVSDVGETISVTIGEGDGTFAEPVTIATGAEPVDLVLGDLDEDGAQDAVVADGGDNTLSIHLNDGAGGLCAARARALTCTPVAAVGGDVNLDGHLDVVVACTGPDQVVVLLGDGTGLLPREVTAALGSAPVDVGLGDLDGDLDPEVITLNAGGMGVLETDCL